LCPLTAGKIEGMMTVAWGGGDPGDPGERRVVTVANAVTAFRLALSVLSGGVFLAGGADPTALWLCSGAIALDAVDGWVARRWRQQTVLGALVDPAADKVAMFVVYGTIAIRANVPALWILFGLSVVRDVSVTGARAARRWAGRAAVESDRAGKIKTVFQNVTGVGILGYAVYGDPGFAFSSHAVVWLVGAGVGFSYITWGRYVAAVLGSRAVGGRETREVSLGEKRPPGREANRVGGRRLAKGSVADQDRPTLTTDKPNGIAGSDRNLTDSKHVVKPAPGSYDSVGQGDVDFA
jgi:phosphatidylglycerophosphate synthase